MKPCCGFGEMRSLGRLFFSFGEYPKYSFYDKEREIYYMYGSVALNNPVSGKCNAYLRVKAKLSDSDRVHHNEMSESFLPHVVEAIQYSLGSNAKLRLRPGISFRDRNACFSILYKDKWVVEGVANTESWLASDDWVEK